MSALWFFARHAIQKADTAEDDKKKSYASLGGFTHLQAPVSKAHLRRHSFSRLLSAIG